MLHNRKVLGLALVSVTLTAAFGTASPAFAKTLRASMNGDKERPEAGDPNGTGTARITTNRARGQVCYRISLSKVGSVAAGHIHKGGASAAGDVVVPLFDQATRRPRGCATGVSRSLIRKIERNPSRYYVNVHNAAYAGGAVRGQLR